MAERNRPSPEGRALGENMARFADVEEAKWREQMGFVPVRCKSCAFRKGTFPNGCLATVGDAMKCSMERKPFMCHQGVNLRAPKNEQHPLSICGGWLLLHSGDAPVKAPWPYSDDQESPSTSRDQA